MKKQIHPLTRYRFERGLNLEGLSKKTGISMPLLSQIENGRRTLTEECAAKIRRATGIKLEPNKVKLVPVKVEVKK